MWSNCKSEVDSLCGNLLNISRRRKRKENSFSWYSRGTVGSSSVSVAIIGQYLVIESAFKYLHIVFIFNSNLNYCMHGNRIVNNEKGIGNDLRYIIYHPAGTSSASDVCESFTSF